MHFEKVSLIPRVQTELEATHKSKYEECTSLLTEFMTERMSQIFRQF